MELSSYGFCTMHSRGGLMEVGHGVLLQVRQGEAGPSAPQTETERAVELGIEHFGAVQKYSTFSKAEVVKELGVEEKSSEVSLISS